MVKEGRERQNALLPNDRIDRYNIERRNLKIQNYDCKFRK